MTAVAASRALPARAGIGLRLPHHGQVLAERPRVAWFEVHPENYMADAHALDELERVRAHYPLSLHAVGLSPGSADGIDAAHVARLAALVRRLEPALVSDHLSWSRSGGRSLPDLLPLPYTDEALDVICRNVQQLQEGLGRRLLLENPSTYLEYADSPLSEPDFMAQLVHRTGCGVLFDVNNVYVSACNRGADPAAELEGWLRALAPASVQEIHLAGHACVERADGRSLRIDDHGDRVCAEVWRLYERAVAALGSVPTLIEWDTRLPAFAVLQEEAASAQRLLDVALAA
jgi:uncharacterized protein (UPF0276 family)